jgi:NAD(P)-dependent dehydrogenase (short-subunit alcohol dehydrogenase family)
VIRTAERSHHSLIFMGDAFQLPQKAATALDHYGHADEIAAMVAFVPGSESAYITGANLTVDGEMNA